MGKGFESTIFSSPIRGSGGDATYRGNCCPGIIEKFIEQYDMKYLSDYAIGSTEYMNGIDTGMERFIYLFQEGLIARYLGI